MTTPIMLNGAITFGSDDERETLIGFIGRLRGLRADQNNHKFSLLEECARFDESGVWQLYGTWTFARVLREECGIKVADYEVYKAVLQHVDADAAREMGMSALREIRRVLHGVAPEETGDIAAVLTTVVQRKIAAFQTEHGFTPTNKGASAIVRTEAERLGLSTKGAKIDGLRQRYQWLVHTLEQIESLSENGSATKVLARNALDRVGGQSTGNGTSREHAGNTAESHRA